jgi:hypothetical protein
MGFFGDLWSGIKSVGSAVLPVANEVLKKSGLVSQGLSMIPGVGGIASGLARSAGYGRRRKRGRGALNDMLKKSGIVSTGLQFVPTVGPVASMIAKSQGYGRKKRGGASKMKILPVVMPGGRRVRKAKGGAMMDAAVGGRRKRRGGAAATTRKTMYKGSGKLSF